MRALGAVMLSPTSADSGMAVMSVQPDARAKAR
jgi:hypothetical protein